MSPQEPKAGASLTYAWFVVAILMIAYVFSFIDRQILNLLVGPIRRDLGISDTQMSLLMGFSFAIFYTILGIPLGRVADSRSRRGLIAAGVVLWSIMTALCGTAKAYWHMFLYRIGVGVGEAALSPAAYSMIADYFPPEKRSTAISVYGMGIYLGAGIAFVLGGLVIQFVSKQGAVELPLIGMTHPWQFVFLILGAAGVVFSLAFALVREPARHGVLVGTSSVPFGKVVSYLWENRRTVLCHNVGFAMIAFCSYGTGAWIPTFFIRNYGVAPGTVGIVYGLIVMVAGCAGIVFGGRLADRWLKQGQTDAALRVGIWAAGLATLSFVVFVVVPSLTLAWVFVAPGVFFIGMPFGAAPAAIQEIVPNRMRGQASAIYLFVVNLIGLGVGPTAVAMITDYVFHDDLAVRWSILIVALIGCGSAMLLLAAGLRPYRETLKRLQSMKA
jgi:MFS family permease